MAEVRIMKCISSMCRGPGRGWRHVPEVDYSQGWSPRSIAFFHLFLKIINFVLAHIIVPHKICKETAGLNCLDHPPLRDTTSQHIRAQQSWSLSRFSQVPKLLCTSVAACHSPGSNKVKCHFIFSPLIGAWLFHQPPSPVCTHRLHTPPPFPHLNCPNSPPLRLRWREWQSPKSKCIFK